MSEPMIEGSELELELESVTAYRCSECSELSEEAGDQKLCECSDCGEKTIERRCPSCNKFCAKLSDLSCVSCEAGEVEEVDANPLRVRRYPRRRGRGGPRAGMRGRPLGALCFRGDRGGSVAREQGGREERGVPRAPRAPRARAEGRGCRMSTPTANPDQACANPRCGHRRGQHTRPDGQPGACQADAFAEAGSGCSCGAFVENYPPPLRERLIEGLEKFNAALVALAVAAGDLEENVLGKNPPLEFLHARWPLRDAHRALERSSRDVTATLERLMSESEPPFRS